MRIKCSVNKKVENYVKEHWPEKKVICNYTNDSSRMRDENRYIQISIPIKDPYLHYEIINNHTPTQKTKALQDQQIKNW